MHTYYYHFPHGTSWNNSMIFTIINFHKLLTASYTRKKHEKKVNIFKDIELKTINSIETIFFNLKNFIITFKPQHGHILKK